MSSVVLIQAVNVPVAVSGKLLIDIWSELPLKLALPSPIASACPSLATSTARGKIGALPAYTDVVVVAPIIAPLLFSKESGVCTSFTETLDTTISQAVFLLILNVVDDAVVVTV